MTTKIYNKLVRDKIPEIILADGHKLSSRVLSDKEYLAELIKKLGEEYEEFKKDVNVEELADLQEIIFAIADVIASPERLEKARMEKAEKRGAFKNKIYLVSVDEVD